MQRIREAERGMIYNEFSERESDIVTGTVQRIENRNYYIDLGKIGRTQGVGDIDTGILIPFYDINLFAPQLIHNRLNTGTLRREPVWVVRQKRINGIWCELYVLRRERFLLI